MSVRTGVAGGQHDDEQNPTEGGGGRLVAGILAAYREGWFPMADPERGAIDWVQPEVRGVIPLHDAGLIVARSLRRRVKHHGWTIRCDSAFEAVMRACAESRPGRELSWIDEAMIGAYVQVHRAGHAHSVEAWRTADHGEVLVGGLYGVRLGGVFFGESMFSRPELGGTDASKVCLVHLWDHLRSRGFTLLDTQMWNPHLGRLGCVETPRAEFLERLAAAADLDVSWQPWAVER